VNKATLRNKITKLETKLIRVQKKFSNSSKPLLSNSTNLYQQKKRGKKRKLEAYPRHGLNFRTPFILEELN